MSLNKTEVFNRLSSDLQEYQTILIVARCSIEYWGRSRSIIGVGDRVIFIKPDTTLMVHSPRGFKPINWMSGPTDTLVFQEDDSLILHSQRTLKPFEEIKIKLESIIDYQSYETEDKGYSHTRMKREP